MQLFQPSLCVTVCYTAFSSARVKKLRDHLGINPSCSKFSIFVFDKSTSFPTLHLVFSMVLLDSLTFQIPALNDITKLYCKQYIFLMLNKFLIYIISN